MECTVENSGPQSRVLFNSRGRAVEVTAGSSVTLDLKEGTAAMIRRLQNSGGPLTISTSEEDEATLAEAAAKPRKPKPDRPRMLPKMKRRSTED